MNSSIQKYNKDNLTMNRKERRLAKRSKRRKAAIAIIAAGLLALSPTVGADVAADVSDDLAIYGGGGGGGGGSQACGGGGGGYISYGDGTEYDFAGGNNGDRGDGSRFIGGGGGVGGGSRYQYKGGGNYLYEWGGTTGAELLSPGIGPNGIIGSQGGYENGGEGAPSHNSLDLKFGISEVDQGDNRNRYAKNGGNAKLKLLSDVKVKDINILAGNGGDGYGIYESSSGGKGGNATLDARNNQLTVNGDMIIASGKRGSGNDMYATGGATDIDVETVYLTKGDHDLKVVDADNNMDIDINTLALEDGSKLNAKFHESINDVSFKKFRFEGEGFIIMTKDKGNFFPEENYLSAIETKSTEYKPEIKFSGDRNTMTISVLKQAPSNVKNGSLNIDNVTKIYTPNKTIYLKKGKSMTVPVKANAKNTSNPKLKWSTNKKKVATVTQSGKIKAKKTGTAKITVKASNGKKITLKVKVVRKAKSVKKFTVRGYSKKMKKGQTKYLTVKLNPKSATNGKIKFKSNKKSVLTVDKAGKLIAKKKGSAKITVKAGSKKKTIRIKVK